MIRKTKAMLELEVKNLRDHIFVLNQDIAYLVRENEFLKKYSTGAHVASLAIAMERVTDASAHLVQSALRVVRR